MRRGGPAALAACLAGALAVLAGPGQGPGPGPGPGPGSGPGPGTGGAAWGGRRPPRSYGHLEGDVRWRRLFSATRFFLRIDGGGGVEGTRWRERPGSIVEIRSVRVGVVAIRAVHTGFYLAMNKRGRLYGSDWMWKAPDAASSRAGTRLSRRPTEAEPARHSPGSAAAVCRGRRRRATACAARTGRPVLCERRLCGGWGGGRGAGMCRRVVSVWCPSTRGN